MNGHTLTDSARALAAHRPLEAKQCPVCSREFTGHKSRVYCSNTCNQRAYRAARRARQPKPLCTEPEANEVRRIRRQLGWTQGQLARTLGVARQTVYYWEKGERQPGEPLLRFLRLVAALGGQLPSDLSRPVLD